MKVLLHHSVFGIILIALSFAANEVGAAHSEACVYKGVRGFLRISNQYSKTNCLARGYIKYSEESTDPWNYLYIETSMEGDDEANAFAAGIIEAELTKDLVLEYVNNTGGGCFGPWARGADCNFADAYLIQQNDYIQRKIKNNTDEDFWYQVHLGLYQLSGFQTRFHNNSLWAREYRASSSLVGYLQLTGTMVDDLATLYVAKTFNRSRGIITDNPFYYDNSDESLGIVKLVPNDILMGHVTSKSYTYMTRIIKRYNFPFHRNRSPNSPRVPGQILSFTSFPGVLYSPDAFMVASTKIAQFATFQKMLTFDPFRVIDEDSVPTWLRAMVSARLALTAAENMEIFKHHQSGLGNNLRIVVDYKAFAENPNSPTGLVFLAEETPLGVWTKDFTSELRARQHFCVSNIPFTHRTQEEFGYLLAQSVFGDIYDFNKNPVQRLVTRLIGNVTNLEQMKNLMRYNNYKHDNESLCTVCEFEARLASLSISPRIDLLDDRGLDNLYKKEAAGAIDAKVLNRERAENGEFFAAFGPTFNDEVPPFDWSHFPHTVIHGQPREFRFGYNLQNWNFTPNARSGKSTKKHKKIQRYKINKRSGRKSSKLRSRLGSKSFS